MTSPDDCSLEKIKDRKRQLGQVLRTNMPTRSELMHLRDEIENTLREGKIKLTKARALGGAAMNELEDGFEDALQDLESSYRRAKTIVR